MHVNISIQYLLVENWRTDKKSRSVLAFLFNLAPFQLSFHPISDTSSTKILTTILIKHHQLKFSNKSWIRKISINGIQFLTNSIQNGIQKKLMWGVKIYD